MAAPPNIGGAQLDQVLSSEPTSFTFGQPNGFSLWLEGSAGMGIPDLESAGSGSSNIGTAEAPITADAPITVEWAGLEVHDENRVLLTRNSQE